jgi:hypothetical protein
LEDLEERFEQKLIFLLFGDELKDFCEKNVIFLGDFRWCVFSEVFDFLILKIGEKGTSGKCLWEKLSPRRS